MPLMLKIIEDKVLTEKHEKVVLLEREGERLALKIFLVCGDWE